MTWDYDFAYCIPKNEEKYISFAKAILVDTFMNKKTGKMKNVTKCLRFIDSLADVFEEFRKVCLDNYKLDPAWYYTSPGLSWDAMLKLTR